MAFAQNGTVDWVSLTSMSISTPITLMSRLAQAGVDQYTIELVKFYGQFLNLRSDYLDTVETSLVRVKKFGFSADILYIGTGISLIPSLLAKTRGGVAFAAITMTLRASFPANFTARVLSEWLRFFERPPDISIPSTSQLQALSNEIAACPIDPEIGRIMWGVEKLHREAIGPHSPYLKSLAVPPTAQDLATAIHAITTMRPSQDAIIKFKSLQKPSPVWLAAFASRVIGLGISYEVDSRVIWEQPPKHCAISGRRGRLRLVVETLDQNNRNSQSPPLGSDSKDYQLLRSAVRGIELNLERQEPRLRSSFRISPKVVVDRILEEFFRESGQRGEVLQCICEAAYHLSRQPAIWFIPGIITKQYLFTRNGTRAALIMLGANSNDLDLWETESKVEAYQSATRIERGWKTHILENNKLYDLRLLFGAPFTLSFGRVCASYEQGVPDDQKTGFDEDVHSLTWSKQCLETIRRVLALWTVLVFAQPIDQHEISIDGRAAYQLERSDGIFSAFDYMWCKIPENILAAQRIHSIVRDTGGCPRVTDNYILQFSAVQEMTFDIIGGRLDANHSSNTNTAGITNGGTFVAMSTLLEPDREISNAAVTFVGQGGIFLNQQATSLVQSVDSNEEDQGFNISSELLKFSKCEHGLASETLIDGINDLTQTPLNRSLYVTERSDTASLAWSLTGRHFSDILVDVLLSPHRILRAVFAAQCIDQFGKLHGPPLSDRRLGLTGRPRDPNIAPLKAMNLECFLTGGNPELDNTNTADVTWKSPLGPAERKHIITLVMMQGNSCARLLALVYYWSRQKLEGGNDWIVLSECGLKNKPLYTCSSEQLRYCFPRFPDGSVVVVY